MPKEQWPPVKWLWAAHAQNAAWYSGEPAALRTVSPFWKSGEKHKTHVPIAQDLASLSAGLIFSGSPTITYDDEATTDRLQKILQKSGFYQKLLQGAELQSPFGGVFLKLDWNKKLAPYPITSIVPGDKGIPTIQNGINTENTFWSIEREEEDTGAIYRLKQIYTSDGKITSALYKGTIGQLGNLIPIDSIAETKGIKPVANSGTNMPLSVYIPNRLPNRRVPHVYYGSSDYEGLYGLFDALDETYSALMRDVRLGKARLIVPVEYLRQKGACLANYDQAGAKQWVFEGDNEYFTALDINPQDSGDTITPIQPEIRSTQYLETIEDIIRKIYQTAGYSPQSAGMDISGQAESGTALNIRERRSMQTAEMKKTYWWQGLMSFIPAMMALDKAVFHSDVKLDSALTVSFADATQPDLATIADTIQKLNAAGAASIETMVRMAHPDWSEEDVLEEVKQIKQDNGTDTEEEDEDLPPENVSPIENPEQEEEPGGDA